MRLQAQTALIENGFVHIPETAPWLAEYLHEMTRSRERVKYRQPYQVRDYVGDYNLRHLMLPDGSLCLNDGQSA
jgi:hypothetical protein